MGEDRVRNTKGEWDFHLEDHPEALVLDQDDEFVLLAFKISKRRLTRYLRFLQQLARMRA
jgi:hypothetical protein